MTDWVTLSDQQDRGDEMPGLKGGAEGEDLHVPPRRIDEPPVPAACICEKPVEVMYVVASESTRRTRSRSWLAWATAVIAALGCLLGGVVANGYAASRDDAPVQAMNAIAACAAETFNPGAADLGDERLSTWQKCQHIVPDDAGLWYTGDAARYVSATMYSIKTGDPLLVQCDERSAPWVGATCVTPFAINYQNKHFKLAPWVQGDRHQYYWTVDSMTNADGSASAAGQAYWNASPWVDCSGSPQICRLVIAPRKPG
jgi:hypothetical protein